MDGSRINLLLKVAFPLDLREAIISEEGTSSFSDDIILRMLRKGRRSLPYTGLRLTGSVVLARVPAGFEGTG